MVIAEDEESWILYCILFTSLALPTCQLSCIVTQPETLLPFSFVFALVLPLFLLSFSLLVPPEPFQSDFHITTLTPAHPTLQSTVGRGFSPPKYTKTTVTSFPYRISRLQSKPFLILVSDSFYVYYTYTLKNENPITSAPHHLAAPSPPVGSEVRVLQVDARTCASRKHPRRVVWLSEIPMRLLDAASKTWI